MSPLGAAWDWYARNREALTAAGALLGGGLLAWGVLQQPAFASRRPKVRFDPHHLPSTTQIFSKAVDQLGSDKIQVCLGGIYILERISRENRQDYAAVMDILTAFIRQRAHWNGTDAAASRTTQKSSRHELSADVAAALTVIIRRENAGQEQDLDLRGTNLSGAALMHAPLRRANFFAANLSDANLASADLHK